MVKQQLIGWFNDKVLASIAINPQSIDFPFAKKVEFVNENQWIVDLLQNLLIICHLTNQLIAG